MSATTRRPTPTVAVVPSDSVPTPDVPPARGAAPAHDEVPHGVDPTVHYMLKVLERQHHSASSERTTQTEQFTGSLDKLGGRFEAKMDAQTGAMVGAARLAAGIVVITLLILGSIAGAVTYFKGGGYEAGTNTTPPTVAP